MNTIKRAAEDALLSTWLSTLEAPSDKFVFGHTLPWNQCEKETNEDGTVITLFIFMVKSTFTNAQPVSMVTLEPFSGWFSGTSGRKRPVFSYTNHQQDSGLWLP